MMLSNTLFLFYIMQKVLYGANVIIFEGIMSFVRPEMREVRSIFDCITYILQDHNLLIELIIKGRRLLHSGFLSAGLANH